MKKWLLHIMLVGVLGMLAASCSQDADDPTQDSRKAQLAFTLALDNVSTGSRTTWGDGYDPSDIGDDFDNRINPAQFHVQIVVDGETYTVKNVMYRLVDEDVKNVYEFMGEVDDIELVGQEVEDVKIKVYVNMDPDNSGSFDVTFSQNTNYIPMFGVHTINKLQLEPNVRNDIGTIYLLRAMAKVEINMNVKGYTLKKVVLNRYNTEGNCLPAGAEGIEYTRDLHYDNNAPLSFNPYSSEGTALTFEEFEENDTQLLFYLAEVRNSDDSNNQLAMELTLEKDGVEVETTYNLFFCNFTNLGWDNQFDVVRNHWYKYNIIAINNGEDLALTLEVRDWDVFSEEIEFTEDVTISNSGRMTYAENVNVKENTDDASILYINGCIDAETALEFNFKIDTPSGATWYASFEGDKDAFAFIDEDENRLIDANGNSSVTGNVGEEATLRIITTEANVSEMKSVTLRIVVITMDRRTIVVNDKLMPDELNESSYYTIRQNLEVAN